ncbi:MAG TPA: lyase family protein [Amaricoccus sp.]|nr:lyase family protein [Amaricoccus sp.]
MAVAAFESPLMAGLYGDAEIAAHFSAEAEIAAMLRFEAALARVEARLGVIPAAAGPAIAQALAGVGIAAADLGAATEAAGIPVPGLVKALRACIAPPHGDFLHWGATSQDAMDTGLVLRLRPVLEILDARLAALVGALGAAAGRHAGLPMAGRTRSQIATPTSFGLRIAGWMAPLARCRDRLGELRPRLLLLQFGGASGNLAALGERGIPVMEALAAELGLGCPAKPWHVERDGLVEFANWLAMVSGLTGRIGADLVLLGRSEIAEAAAGAGGASSTMPQKANPVLAETLVTLARFSAAQAGLAQQALLQTEERDGAAWAVEWLCLPPMAVAAGAGLRHATALVADLRPDPARMAAAIELNGGAAYAEALAFGLARHMPLKDAQEIVKAAAAAQAATGGRLIDRVNAACAARGLPAQQLDLESQLAPGRELVERAVKASRG